MTTHHRYRYSSLERKVRKFYRKFFPVPTSPWTAGKVKDICAVNLVPPKKLIDFFMTCVVLLKKLKGDNIGDYLEFGVFNGNSIGSMFYARKIMNLKSMRLFGFDAFQGLPAGSELEDDGVWKKGFYACSFEKTEECLSRRGILSTEIEWVKGWYNETLTDELALKFSLRNFGIVFVDCDTYSSSKTVLDFIALHISQPLIICFDDWKLNDLDIKGMGEYKSFNEFLDNNPNILAKEIRSYNRKSKTFLLTVAH
jgi:O-methyltransferase